MKPNIIIILIILIIILIICIILKPYNNSYIETMANYMTASELSKYLINDEDNYCKNFSYLDLKVRKVDNINEYFNNIKKSCVDIDEHTVEILNDCINRANNKLKHYNCIGFDGSKCANLQWNIGLVRDKLYEEGYPHTRHNVIIIPLNLLYNRNQLTNTLIHEKIHVYQKTYPEDIEKYLNANGFKKYKLKDNNGTGNIRSNPDMNEWIYKNNKDEIMMAKYISEPKSIMDVKITPNNNSKYEHPFEFMAYDITNKL